jgi:hypothetical protein
MKTKVCDNCKKEFPARKEINGEIVNFYSRKFCLDCSPYKEYRRINWKTKKCKGCGKNFLLSKTVNGGTKNLHGRTFCFDCSFSNDILQTYKLNNIQQQILYGHLLGDGSMSPSIHAQNASLRIERTARDREYLEWTASYFKELLSPAGITESIKSRHDKEYPCIRFGTRSLPVFNQYYDQWYPEGKKIVPKDLILTPLIIAVWLADDGCVASRKREINHSPTLEVTFATHGFIYDDVVFLWEQLKQKYGEYIYIQGHREHKYMISISHNQTARLLLRDITPVFPDLSRKSNIWLAPEIDLWADNLYKRIGVPYIDCIYCGSNSIRKYGWDNGKQTYWCNDCHKYYRALDDYSSPGKIPLAARKFMEENGQAI